MSRYEKIEEPIDARVSFKEGETRPCFFSWQGKKYEIEEVSLVHKEKKDGKYRWYFSCFDGINYFKLCFCPQELNWTLEELYCEEG